MRWGQAFRAMMGPALLVGPFLGGLGLASMAGFLMLMEDSPASIFGLVLGLVLVGLVMGFVVASPLALAFGAILLRLSATDPRWLLRRVWAGAGLAVGIAASLPFAPLWGAPESWAVLAATFAVLGPVGALICRRMVASKVTAVGAVDPDIFA